MRIAVYPGSFDPITLGHLNIIERAARNFDKVIVCVMVNSEKHYMFSDTERVDFIRRVTRHLPNVEADSSDELLAEYTRRRGISVVVKGLRAVTDFENEFMMAMINHKLNPRSGYHVPDGGAEVSLPQLQHRQRDGTLRRGPDGVFAGGDYRRFYRTNPSEEEATWITAAWKSSSEPCMTWCRMRGTFP